MHFLQSPEWEQFQQSVGRKTWRVQGVLLIEHALPYGFRYLYCPRPEDLSDDFFIETEKIARAAKALFLKIDPASQKELRITNYELRKSQALQPRKTIIVDLTKPEDVLLSEMHKKTRYCIREAEGSKVVSRQSLEGSQKEDFEIFWKLLSETTERSGFHAHPKDYYQKLLAVKSPDFSNELFFAEYEEKSVAAALVNIYKDTAAYLHGASSSEGDRHSASHLLQWEIMKELKRRGIEQYDLWGIDEQKWPGVTRFKVRFGGEMVEYQESVDAVYRRWMYRMYSTVRRLTK